jgi:hypothetical protein
MVCKCLVFKQEGGRYQQQEWLELVRLADLSQGGGFRPPLSFLRGKNRAAKAVESGLFFFVRDSNL